MTNITNQCRTKAIMLSAALATCTFLCANSPQANAQNSRSQVERATWTPTRTASKRSVTQRNGHTDADASPVLEPERRVSRKRKVSAPAPRSQVRQASHQVPTPPPLETISYAGTVYDGSCDSLGGACGCGDGGCDGIACGGCDAMGSCGPNCGCSMCGELPSGRAWRPALTLSLPQDGWISFEALHMWTDGMELPPLVTTAAPVIDAPAGNPGPNGVLGRAGTSTLYGGGDILDQFDGGRLRFGFWLDRCHTLGIGAEYLELDRESESFSAAGDGTGNIIARPFFNFANGRQDSQFISAPDLDTTDGINNAVSGTISVHSYSELAGGSVYLRKLRCCDEGCREWLFCGCKGHYCSRSEFRIGYRFMELDEGVHINEMVNALDGSGSFNINDRFDTTNQFNGLDLGWSHRVTRGYWTWDGLVRIAVGNTRQNVTIRGDTTLTEIDSSVTPPTTTVTPFNGGILALANIGSHDNDEFSVLPEINLTVGYQLTDHLKATVGYTGIYWSNVVRPGQHIPGSTNSDFFQPPAGNATTEAGPLFTFDTTDYWAHGINYGLEYRW